MVFFNTKKKSPKVFEIIITDKFTNKKRFKLAKKELEEQRNLQLLKAELYDF